MSSLESHFRELEQRLRDRTSLRSTGGDPVYYLVFRPEEMLKVKRRLKTWQKRLELADWEVRVLSLAEVIEEFFATYPLRAWWLDAEQGAELGEVNDTLRAALVDTGVVEQRILAALADLEGKPNALLFITDVEALHPYLRIGAIEQRLQGKVTVPVVILYPGTRRGQTNLSFLGIYPEDGNYRSIHIGG